MEGGDARNGGLGLATGRKILSVLRLRTARKGGKGGSVVRGWLEYQGDLPREYTGDAADVAQCRVGCTGTATISSKSWRGRSATLAVVHIRNEVERPVESHYGPRAPISEKFLLYSTPPATSWVFVDMRDKGP